MMENRKKIGLLIIIIAVLLLVIIVVLLLKKTDSSINEPGINNSSSGSLVGSETSTPTTTPGDKPRNYQTYDVSKEAPYQVGSSDAAKISALFVERFGSFSNQSDYSNVTDLKIFMTSSMRDWADSYVADLKSQKYSGEYYGITTNALTTKVSNYDDKAGKAQVVVMTERREDRGNTLGTPYKQSMSISLVKENNEWLIDNAVWDKK